MSNEAVKLRQAQRADCVNQSMSNEIGQANGRLESPIIEAPVVLPRAPTPDLGACCEALRQIGVAQYDLLMRTLRSIEKMSDEFPMSFIQQTLVQTKDSVPFVVMPVGGVVNLGPAISSGAFTTISSIEVSEGYVGILKKFGTGIFPQSDFANIVWRMAINDSAQPKFTSNQFIMNTLATPLDFEFSIPTGRTLVLSAKNIGAVPVDVSAVLTGFLRPLR